METIRRIGDFELVFEPLMKMFRIINKGSGDLSMWFDSETAKELQEMDGDEFSTTAQQYIQDASYVN